MVVVVVVVVVIQLQRDKLGSLNAPGRFLFPGLVANIIVVNKWMVMEQAGSGSWVQRSEVN